MDTTLVATRRESRGRNNAGRLRRAGQIPAVLYGGEAGKVEALSVDPKALSHILHSQSGVNTLIGLKLDGVGDVKVLVKEYQLEPVGHTLLHADFYRVAMDKVLRVTVPIHLTGEAKGVKLQGGIVDFVHREIAVECLPADIPEHITVDVTELMLHDGVRVRDLIGVKWKAVSDADTLIVHVIAPKAEPEPVAADAAAAAGTTPAEPEVIKKGKVEKEGEEADAKDAKKDSKK
jgi:large subunit ribosomal protein L25